MIVVSRRTGNVLALVLAGVLLAVTLPVSAAAQGGFQAVFSTVGFCLMNDAPGNLWDGLGRCASFRPTIVVQPH
jgi:predicted secreted Zn-dependent protease